MMTRVFRKSATIVDAKLMYIALGNAGMDKFDKRVPQLDGAGRAGGHAERHYRQAHAEVQKALGGDLRRRLEDVGIEVAGGTPEELAALIRTESVKHAKLIEAANVTPQ